MATSGILTTAASSRVIVLTTYETDADIVRAVEAGAAGYLLKDTSRPDLVAAIRSARAGGDSTLPVGGQACLAPAARPAAEPLSARETEVLTLVARGQTNAEIGRALYISEATVQDAPAPRVWQARRLRPDGGRHQGRSSLGCSQRQERRTSPARSRQP